jgi:hypothetical protein
MSDNGGILAQILHEPDSMTAQRPSRLHREGQLRLQNSQITEREQAERLAVDDALSHQFTTVMLLVRHGGRRESLDQIRGQLEPTKNINGK